MAASPEGSDALAQVEPAPAALEQAEADDQKQQTAEQVEDAARQQSINNLKHLSLAMHNCMDSYGQFPPAALYSKDGKPLLSWRVLLLPYLDQRELYEQFKLDEPWDGPTNKKLVAKMPAIYSAIPGKAKETQDTVYQFSLAQTVFPSPKASKMVILLTALPIRS